MPGIMLPAENWKMSEIQSFPSHALLPDTPRWMSAMNTGETDIKTSTYLLTHFSFSPYIFEYLLWTLF